MENAWNWGTFWSRIALWFLVISTILIPFVALSGQPAIIAPMGLVPLAGLLAVFLRPQGVSPLWGGVIAYWPDRILENEERRIRFLPDLREGIPLGGGELRLNARRVAGVLFAEALLAEYYALMEYAAGKADVTLIFVSFVLFVTAGLGVGSRPGRLRNIGLSLVTVAIVAVTVVFALGGKSGIDEKVKAIGNDDAKAAPAAIMPAPSCPFSTLIERQITLQGLGKWASTGVDLSQLEGGLDYEFHGPSGTWVRFVSQSGKVIAEGLINQNFAVQGGIPEFSGEAGYTATLCVESS
ncbi:MAG: hypothetical protein HYT48_00115 [Candidatus Vogelbacteria bacterium]|nr:hypothetical protein [Candidatus Vogelbacteria bacterium]